MVAELHEHLDGAEAVDLLPVQDVLHVLGADEVLVHVLLDASEVAAHNLHQLRGEVLCVEGVDAAEDELVDDAAHLVLGLPHPPPLPLGRGGLPPP